MYPNLSDRTAEQLLAVRAFQLHVMHTELLAHGHVRHAATSMTADTHDPANSCQTARSGPTLSDGSRG